jgi:nucleoside-diphosphate kinase
MTEQTLAILKPDTVSKSLAGQIIAEIETSGFAIKAMKLVQLSKEQAEIFYQVHKERPFFNDLVTFMMQGPIVPIALEKQNAVKDFRNLIGATNPQEADRGTIRHKYASSIDANAIHGSDSPENALQEISFFFPED